MSRNPLARGPQGSTRLSSVDSALLVKWTNKHGYDGAAKCLGVTPTVIYKLLYGGVATSASVKRLTDALHSAERRLWTEMVSTLVKSNEQR